MSDLMNLATGVVEHAQKSGATEASVTVARGPHTSIVRRGGRVEQATRSTTRGLVVSLLVDNRFSSHSTSDLRPEALKDFIVRAIAATRLIEKDSDRAQPDVSLCGRCCSEPHLDLFDPAIQDRQASDRSELALELERAVNAVQPEGAASSAQFVGDGAVETVRVMSNGFSGVHRSAWFALGGEMTLTDPDGRRPEATAYFSARYLDDLPGPDEVAAELVRRATERLGSGAIDSGSYPLLLSNRAAGQILGVLGGPLSGAALHQGRSCLTDRLETRIGSSKLTIVDDPTLPRGLGSRPWDGDGMTARPRTIVEQGILKSYYLNVYHARKLGTDPTTGGRSNWVIPPGDRPGRELARDLPRAIEVTGFLGGNSNSVTGDFSFGIRGMLLENGEPVQPLSEMNVSGNLLSIFDHLLEVGSDPWTYSSTVSPTLLFDEVQFSGL